MADGNRSRVPVKLVAAGDTHIGGRSHNEDAILLRPDLNLYVVADGAGGQNAGNVASSLATTSIAHFFEQTKKGAAKLPQFDALGLPVASRRLSAAVQEANKEIIGIAKNSKRHRGMGTTVVAALFSTDYRALHIAYVGDSRCYRLRDTRLELLSHDHSLANDVLELRPDAEDARIQKLPPNVITRALGMSNDLRVSSRSHELAHGDRYVLCSDGLSDVIDRVQITEALGLDAGPEERVRLLIDMAIEAGADDNVAVIVIDCTFAARKAQSATKPMRKLTPVNVPRIEGPPRVPMRSRGDSLTEESVPEIVLYQEGQDRDSTPMIHVVPTESASQELADAVGPIIGPEGGPRPRTAPPPPSNPPPVLLPPDRIPSLYAYSGDSDDDDDGSDYVPVELGGAAAGVSAPRLHKPDVAVQVDAPGRTGNTKQPPSPAVFAATKAQKPIAQLPIDDDAATIVRERPTAAIKSAIQQKAASAVDARKGVPRPDAGKKPPPLPPGRKKEEPVSQPVVSRPEPRGLMTTSDYIGEDTVPCHACGSIIARTAEYCLYCGATTKHGKK